MKRMIICCASITAVVLFSAYAEPTGRWYKPFDGESFNYIEHMYGSPNRLWFTTENGVGCMEISTRKTTFFSYRSIGIKASRFGRYYRIVSGNSTRVSLYAFDDAQVYLLQYDGTNWTQTVCPEKMNWLGKLQFKVTADNAGNVWINDGEKMYRYDGTSWTLIADEAFDTISQVYSVDSTGQLIVGIADTSSDTVTVLAQFDGRNFKPFATFDESARYTFFVDDDSKGSVWIGGKYRLYEISSKKTVTPYPLDTAHLRLYSGTSATIDNAGNIWTSWFDPLSDVDPLICYEIATGKIKISELKEYIQTITTCDDGVYVHNQLDATILHIKNNDMKVTGINLSKQGSCANFTRNDKLLFRRNGSVVKSFGNSVISYDSTICTSLPSLLNVKNIIERVDGTLFACNESETLYVLKDNKWILDQVLEPTMSGNLIFDVKNQLWGTVFDYEQEDFTLTHQTEKGWELIDTNNSNLSIRSSSNPDLLADRDGGIWINAQGAIARTLNGYKWTIYDSTNSFPPGRVERMYTDHKGAISFLFKSGCVPVSMYDNHCSSIIRMKFRGNTFQADTFKAPITLTVFSELFEDGAGDVWITDAVYNSNFREMSSTLYRQTASGWIKYDSSNTPFVIESYLGEDTHGRIYFNDEYNETVVFDRNAANAFVIHKHRLPATSPVRCFAAGNVLMVEYAVEKPQTLEFALYTALGQRILLVKSNEKSSGTFRKRLTINAASGMHILKVTSPGYSQTSRVLVH